MRGEISQPVPTKVAPEFDVIARLQIHRHGSPVVFEMGVRSSPPMTLRNVDAGRPTSPFRQPSPADDDRSSIASWASAWGSNRNRSSEIGGSTFAAAMFDAFGAAWLFLLGTARDGFELDIGVFLVNVVDLANAFEVDFRRLGKRTLLPKSPIRF
ncbi:MAG: hypothetical protein ACRC1K_19795 [Planctomycetia bacterium]